MRQQKTNSVPIKKYEEMTIEELQRCKQHLTEESKRVIDSIKKSQRILDYWKDEIEQIDKLLANGNNR